MNKRNLLKLRFDQRKKKKSQIYPNDKNRQDLKVLLSKEETKVRPT